MEFEMENYKLRATEDGKIERFYEYKTRPDRWKELKGRDINEYLQIALYLTSGKREFKVHRLVYFAHNQDWNIYDAEQFIDHRDRNPQNNKIGNLRAVTNQQNQFNTNAKGYTYREELKKFEAQIRTDGKLEYLGYYDTAEEAHQAYLDAKAKLHII
jgi:hypothetical protein